MLAPLRSASQTAHIGRSSVFAGPHVQLDDGRWSPAFAAQLNAWASAPGMLLVMESGTAMGSVPGPLSLCEQACDAGATIAPATVVAPRVRPLERCAVFRFDGSAVHAALSAPHASPASVVTRMQRIEPAIVPLSPPALFRYYWRRRALDLDYPAPVEHVEEDAKALLRHVVSRARAEGHASASESPARLRHRALAQRASALMAQSIADPHPTAQIARALATSPFHLAHVFRTELGSSPHQYLVRLRLVAALVQLRADASDLSKLALELGFCHHSHFTAVFRQAIGYTPRQVRRMLTATCVADLGIAARQCS